MNPTHLLQGCRQRDPAAQEALVRAYQPSIYRLAVSFLQDPDEAQDVAQETFLIALDHLDDYRGQAALSTWLYGIALNLCRVRLRRRRGLARLVGRLQELLLSRPVMPSGEAVFLQSEGDQALWRAIGALNEKQRLPLILFYYHDLPVSEIAQVLGLPPGTVISRLHAARERLRKALGGVAQESEVEG